MNTLEDRIRAATIQTAEEIAPGSIRPLPCTAKGPWAAAVPGPAGPPEAGQGSARWPRVLIPVAAAASVIAVVAASLAVTGGLGDGRRRIGGKAGRRRTAPRRSSALPAAPHSPACPSSMSR